MPWKEQDRVDQRTEFVLRSIGGGVVFQRLCEEYGISPKTGYKWRKRFIEDGLNGMHDRSRRPKCSPRSLSEDVICELIRLKNRHMNWGPVKIHDLYDTAYGKGPSLSSVKRVLDKAGLVKKRKRRGKRDMARISERVKASKPNEVWTVDFKGWWKMANAKRCEPLTIRDAYSWYIIGIRAMESTKTEDVQREFEAIFRVYGLPEYIRSDNGSPFASVQAPAGLSRLSAWWIGLGIRLDRSRPGHVGDNAHHERMHLDIRNELEGMIEGGKEAHQAAFDIWREEFNEIRPHESLGMRRPAEVYEKSERRYEECELEIAYPDNFMERKVSKRGVIRLWSRSILITTSLAGWNVGLKHTDDKTLDVYFDYLRLGEIDLKTFTFHPTVRGNS